MAITISSVTTNAVGGTGSSISVTTPAASVGDLLIIILSNDYYALSDLALFGTTPSTTATEITNFDDDGGNLNKHVKAWWAPVTTAGAVTVNCDTGHSDEEKTLAVYVLTGADTSNPIDGAANSGTQASGTSVVAPAVSPSGSNDLLICHLQIDMVTITPPGTMTNQYNVTDGTFTRSYGATQQLSASGSTGTRTFTSGATTSWVASTMAIKASSTGSPVGVTAWLRA